MPACEDDVDFSAGVEGFVGSEGFYGSEEGGVVFWEGFEVEELREKRLGRGYQWGVGRYEIDYLCSDYFWGSCYVDGCGDGHT